MSLEINDYLLWPEQSSVQFGEPWLAEAVTLVRPSEIAGIIVRQKFGEVVVILLFFKMRFIFFFTLIIMIIQLRGIPVKVPEVSNEFNNTGPVSSIRDVPGRCPEGKVMSFDNECLEPFWYSPGIFVSWFSIFLYITINNINE